MRAVDLDIVIARLLGGDAPAWRGSAPVTREAAAKALAEALGLAPVEEPETLYADDVEIGAEFRAYVYALRESGAQQGVPGNEYKPKSGFTRAELVQSAYSSISLIADGDVTGGTYEKALIVRRPGLTVKDGVVRGDLVVGRGVGDGDITLDNATVTGRLVVYGGGDHSIVIKGGSKVAAVVTGKPNVHIQLESGASIQSIQITEAGVRITVQKGASIETLTNGANGATVEGEGSLSSVTVKPEAAGAVVKTPNTIIINAGSDYVTTANGTVKAGDTQTTPAAPSVPSGGGGGSSGTPPSTGPTEPAIAEVTAADELARIIKAGTGNVRIVVKNDMTVTSGAVDMYEPFGVYDLLLKDNSVLYVPQGVTLTIGDTNDPYDARVTFRIGGHAGLEIDGTLSVEAMWVGGKLTVNGALIYTGNGNIGFDGYAEVDGAAESIRNIVLPKKSYTYNMGFAYVDGVYTYGSIYLANAATEQQLRDITEDKIAGFNISGIFDITAPVAARIWVVEDDAILTVKSDFTVVDTLNVAGEIAGAEGGRVIIPAGAQIKNVLWGGGWISEENGTDVLHGLPVDESGAERIYIRQNGAWTLVP